MFFNANTVFMCFYYQKYSNGFSFFEKKTKMKNTMQAITISVDGIKVQNVPKPAKAWAEATLLSKWQPAPLTRATKPLSAARFRRVQYL